MKNELNIFCNNDIKSFLQSLLSEYESTIMKLDLIKENIHSTQANIIIINNNKDIDLIKYSELSDNCLIILSHKDLNLNLKNKSNILICPLSINQLKSKIKNFVQNLKVQFHDIFIYNEKLTNLDNDNFCYLTKIELEILSHLIKKKETSKSFIKENILNIKSNIETNSLESHLTRIRKKMKIVKTKVKIQAKNEKLLIKV
ncbi:helix-turn-helix domain-containing protein [Pelagibacteraceae bacterium]|nr:helix-turn-helix domain-containing protein [Pelagibacteraceae bacterium]